MLKINEIKFQGQVIPVCLSTDEKMMVPLIWVANVMGIDYEQEKVRIMKNPLLTKLFREDSAGGWFPLSYLLGYIGTILFDENIDLELRKKYYDLYNTIYEFQLEMYANS